MASGPVTLHLRWCGRTDDALGWEVTQAAMASLSGTADTQEGVRAFLEKRPPVWTGR